MQLLEATVTIAEEAGLDIYAVSATDAQKIDQIVRLAMLQGYDLCRTQLSPEEQRRVDVVREELATRLLPSSSDEPVNQPAPEDLSVLAVRIVDSATADTVEYMERRGWHRCSAVIDRQEAIIKAMDLLGDPDYRVLATKTCAGFIMWETLKE